MTFVVLDNHQNPGKNARMIRKIILSQNFSNQSNNLSPPTKMHNEPPAIENKNPLCNF